MMRQGASCWRPFTRNLVSRFYQPQGVLNALLFDVFLTEAIDLLGVGFLLLNFERKETYPFWPPGEFFMALLWSMAGCCIPSRPDNLLYNRIPSKTTITAIPNIYESPLVQVRKNLPREKEPIRGISRSFQETLWLQEPVYHDPCHKFSDPEIIQPHQSLVINHSDLMSAGCYLGTIEGLILLNTILKNRTYSIGFPSCFAVFTKHPKRYQYKAYPVHHSITTWINSWIL